ncbi:RNA polymerase sigma factor [Actinoalloteichus hoggarensis]|uniref:RNA polymerase sigma factor n=1 Tax=Actinoalloteichus hoggarensis TaxID=1470176 RepID=UPI000B8B3287|nr:sigma factor [Actinoalloteichus hoggarensis]
MSPKPFEQIVTEHGPLVLRVCRAVLGQTDAEDAWSETSLAALRTYPDLHRTAAVQAWLITIADRKAVDITRTRARDPVTTAPGLPAACESRSAEPFRLRRTTACRRRGSTSCRWGAGVPRLRSHLGVPGGRDLTDPNPPRRRGAVPPSTSGERRGAPEQSGRPHWPPTAALRHGTRLEASDRCRPGLRRPSARRRSDHHRCGRPGEDRRHAPRRTRVCDMASPDHRAR